MDYDLLMALTGRPQPASFMLLCMAASDHIFQKVGRYIFYFYFLLIIKQS